MATNILMPALSPTMEEGKLSRWLVKEGDAVKAGDVLAEIETDKATMEVEAVDEGWIGKILVPAGTDGVKVNAPLALLLAEGEQLGVVAPSAAKQNIESAMNAQDKPAKAAALKVEVRKSGTVTATPPKPAAGGGTRIFASPLARRIAAQKGVDLATLVGSGPRGRIVKSDVEQSKSVVRALSTKDGAAGSAILGVAMLPDAKLFYPAGSYDETPHDSMRKAIAKRLTSAKTLIPHYYLTVDCNLDALLAARERMNTAAPLVNGGEGRKDKIPAYKLSVNDFIVKASAMALMKHRDVNASWTDTAILHHKEANVGVAVALDFGLITPIVFQAQTKGLVEISAEIKSLATRAREKKLKPSEYEGGGFSVSNLGMLGIKNFTAIINPPQSCILAVGAGEACPIVVNGKIEVATLMTVTMSVDHRVVDGSTGAKFLATFKQFIEEPASMLL